MNIPIIRLEVEGMKHSMITALSKHTLEMDSCIQAALNAYCTPENISTIVQTAAIEALDAAVKEEVRDFFRLSGPGRQAVREAVTQYLDNRDALYAGRKG